VKEGFGWGVTITDLVTGMACEHRVTAVREELGSLDSSQAVDEAGCELAIPLS